MCVVNNITPNGPKFDLNIVVKFDNEKQWLDFFLKTMDCESKSPDAARFQSLKFRRPTPRRPEFISRTLIQGP